MGSSEARWSWLDARSSMPQQDRTRATGSSGSLCWICCWGRRSVDVVVDLQINPSALAGASFSLTRLTRLRLHSLIYRNSCLNLAMEIVSIMELKFSSIVYEEDTGMTVNHRVITKII
ncbi:uncharacterized protein LOC123428634 [Hordeum vulgare subsp. vulgare]|uniref:uncharacterized protein LOC123428634 n=1 Tax=Hordeum vulgare subsp. vulgare TaxID=112509 RepID=UPI001D1A3834|nr:uncharacterized protein LOC123428634 [Hordeum vulgare subsp. vulgare]